MIVPVGSSISLVATITLTGAAASGLFVTYKIKRSSDDKYYTGAAWVASESWIALSEADTGVYVGSFDQSTDDTTHIENYLVTYKCADSGYEFLATEVYEFGDVASDVTLTSIQNDVIDILKLTGYKVTKSGDVITIYESDGTTLWRKYNLASGGRVQV